MFYFLFYFIFSLQNAKAKLDAINEGLGEGLVYTPQGLFSVTTQCKKIILYAFSRLQHISTITYKWQEILLGC